MFTVKASRRGPRGEERVSLYEALSVSVVRHDPALGSEETCVVLYQANGDEPCIMVTPSEPVTSDDWPCHQVIVENAAGKTTDVIRPPKVKRG